MPEFKLYIIADATAPAALVFGPFVSSAAANTWFGELKQQLNNEWYHKMQTIRRSFSERAHLIARFKHIATQQWFTAHLVELENGTPVVTSPFDAARELQMVLLNLDRKPGA